jgi:hypothetical protein
MASPKIKLLGCFIFISHLDLPAYSFPRMAVSLLQIKRIQAFRFTIFVLLVEYLGKHTS